MLWLLACTSAPTPAPPPLPRPRTAAAPSFLVIVADDLGTDKVGVYGEHPRHPPTPAIDALAREGLLFRNGYATPVCSSSRAALLTGRYGRRTGMGGVIDAQSTYELPLAEVTVAEVLERDGYESVALGKWHLSGPRTPSGATHPNLQGFDHYEGALDQLAASRKHADERGPYYRFEKVTDGRTAMVDRYATTDTTDDAIRWLGEVEPPWFLYVAYHAPHVPLHVPPAGLAGRDLPASASDLEKYDATVQALDAEIGRLLAALTPDQRASTLVVFAGDNGTDRGVVLPPLDPDHGKASVFEGGTHVPFLVSGPMVARPGAETEALVHLVDVLPTFAELAGVAVTDLVLDGTSFAPVLRDPTSAGGRRFVYTERFSPLGPGPYDLDLVAVRDDRYKVLRDRRGALSFHDLAGRHDDGPGRRPASLRGPERRRYDALVEELNRVSARSSPR